MAEKTEEEPGPTAELAAGTPSMVWDWSVDTEQVPHRTVQREHPGSIPVADSNSGCPAGQVPTSAGPEPAVGPPE
jgi:hypothetical protein